MDRTDNQIAIFFKDYCVMSDVEFSWYIKTKKDRNEKVEYMIHAKMMTAVLRKFEMYLPQVNINKGPLNKNMLLH